MSKNLLELCCSIIDDCYGETYARLFARLSEYGRLSSVQLAQKCQLPIRQVKSSLAALVQLRLIYHHTTSDGASTYQVNAQSTYEVLRNGKLTQLVRVKHGKVAAEVIQQAILLGFATTEELSARTHASILTSNQEHAKGDTNAVNFGNISIERIDGFVEQLLGENFLIRVRTAHFQTTFDATQDAEKYLKSTGRLSTLKGSKGQIEAENQIAHELRVRRNTTNPEHGFVPKVGDKRGLDDKDEPNAAKRRKLANGSLESVLVCVSYRNVVMETRNRLLTRDVRKRLGPAEGDLLGVAFTQVPPKGIYEDETDVVRTIHVDIVRYNYRPSSRSTKANGVTNGTAATNGIHSDYEDEDNNEIFLPPAEIETKLGIIADSSLPFLRQADTQDQWLIDKDMMNKHLQEQEILRLMSDRIAHPAMRIIRMLMEKGKLDEKQLQEIGLLGAKELRQILAQLKQMGFVDLQEVPREAQRQPTRTIYLWFHDTERVRKLLLENLYKTMARLMQRLKLERQKLSSTLEKIERSDVKGKEKSLLPDGELRVLKRWQKTEQWLVGEIGRLDDSVVILRDL